MKLPYKYLIGILSVLLAALAVYSVVVMNTTARDVKEAIVLSDRKTLDLVAREVNAYFFRRGNMPAFVQAVQKGKTTGYAADYAPLFDRVRPLIGAGRAGQGADILLIDKEGAAISIMTEGTPPPLTVAQRAALQAKTNAGASVEKGILTLVASGGPGWLVVFRQPAGNAYAIVSKLQFTFGVLIPSAIAALLLLGIWLTHRHSRSIESIVSGMETVAAGNMDYKIPADPAGELIKVVTIFNDMVARLNALKEEMKKKERLSAIGQMANILGHEIRNPLSAISGSVFLIKRQVSRMPGTEALLKPLDIIQKEIISTNKIINDMLDFSRQRPPVLSEHDICEVVRGIMAETPVPENVAVNIAAAGAYKVWIDIEEMKQVIRNMVNNAVDSMAGKPNASLTITVGACTLSRPAGPADGISLAISDTGCGMAPEVAARIFEPFYSTKSKGTGLGLAVVRRIVEERHGGIIEVNSTVGQGTTMMVKLPVKKPT